MVAAEHRCSEYNPVDYRYSQSVEPRIVASMGGIIYGRTPAHGSTAHLRPTSSTLSHAPRPTTAASAQRILRRSGGFASGLLNLTLASPSVNRSQKSDKDAADWLPDLNQCWFANRVVKVRQQYTLTID